MNQREIALALGVSQTTVSLVVNNPKTEKVSKEKRELILDFINQNDYPVLGTSGRTRNIGYLLPEGINDAPYSRFYDRFIIGIEAAASEAGYSVIVEKYKKEENLIFPHRKVDGVIIERKCNASALKEIAERLPVVMLNYSVCEPVCDMVYPDNSGGVELAVNYLKQQGHRRIAYFSPTVHNIGNEANYNQRLNSFSGCIRTLGLEESKTYIHNPILKKATVKDTEDSIRDMLVEWKKMTAPPTAVVCCNDFYALLMIRWANLLGITVPDELSIIGTDNIPNSELSFPALTSIDHNAEEMGRLSVEALIKRIENPDRPTRRISCNASLVIRESVANIKTGEKIEKRKAICGC
jgi:DNA-binding LacI/PurR family transcriptional regulator